MDKDRIIKHINCIDLSLHTACYLADKSLVNEPLDNLYEDETLIIIKDLLKDQKEKLFLKNYGFYFKKNFPNDEEK